MTFQCHSSSLLRHWNLHLLLLLFLVSCVQQHEIHITEEESRLPWLVPGVSAYLLSQSIRGGAGAARPPTVYSLTSSKWSALFQMNSTTGELWLVGRLDRDSICPFQAICVLHLSALLDRRQRVAFQVLVDDLNDVAPHWVGYEQHHSPLRVEFSENKDSIAVNLEAAVDEDAPRNGQIHYQLVDQSHWFALALDSSGQMLVLQSLKSLDREQKEQFSLTVLAADSGSPPLTGTLSILVLVTDVNDHAPHFNTTVYRRVLSQALSERAAVGSEVLTVHATDGDIGDNARLNYSMPSRSQQQKVAGQYFQVDAQLGVIRVKQTLNYDVPPEEQMFVFTVIATDNAPSAYRLTGTATVTIQLADENDERPVIDVSFVNPLPPPSNNVAAGADDEGWILENQPPGQIVAFMHVTDPDLQGKDPVTCRLHEPSNFTLKLTSREGGLVRYESSVVAGREYKIFSRIPFDREDRTKQEFRVICVDSVGAETQQSHSVVIADENDCQPRFVQTPFQFSVMENSPSRVVGRVEAVDDDDDTGQSGNAKVLYQLVPGDHLDVYFRLDEHTGELHSKVAFDREWTDQYVLQIQAVDGGEPSLTGRGEVIVHILDENDSPPVFTMTVFSFTVRENAPQHSWVGAVEASDADIDSYGQVWYRWKDNRAGDYFLVDSNTGKISIQQALDRESVGQFNFTVIACDLGWGGKGKLEAFPQQQQQSQQRFANANAKCSSAIVLIDVEDENDNSPVFDPMPQADIFISEIAPHRVMETFSASDLDSGNNGRVKYTIVKGNEEGLFHLNALSGELVATTSLNPSGQQLSNRKLFIQACDAGVPQRCSGIVEILLHMQITPSQMQQGPVTLKSAQLHSPQSADNNYTLIYAVMVIVMIALMLAILMAIVVFVLHRSHRRKQEYKAPAPTAGDLNDRLQNADLMVPFHITPDSVVRSQSPQVYHLYQDRRRRSLNSLQSPLGVAMDTIDSRAYQSMPWPHMPVSPQRLNSLPYDYVTQTLPRAPLPMRAQYQTLHHHRPMPLPSVTLNGLAGEGLENHSNNNWFDSLNKLSRNHVFLERNRSVDRINNIYTLAKFNQSTFV